MATPTITGYGVVRDPLDEANILITEINQHTSPKPKETTTDYIAVKNIAKIVFAEETKRFMGTGD